MIQWLILNQDIFASKFASHCWSTISAQLEATIGEDTPHKQLWHETLLLNGPNRHSVIDGDFGQRTGRPVRRTIQQRAILDFICNLLRDRRAVRCLFACFSGRLALFVSTSLCHTLYRWLTDWVPLTLSATLSMAHCLALTDWLSLLYSLWLTVSH